MPMLQIYGNSVMPALEDGQIIYAVKTSDFEPGEIAAFYYTNKILVKRIICGPGANCWKKIFRIWPISQMGIVN